MTNCNYQPYADKHPDKCQVTTTTTQDTTTTSVVVVPTEPTTPPTPSTPTTVVVTSQPITPTTSVSVGVPTPTLPATGGHSDPIYAWGLGVFALGCFIVALARKVAHV